MKNLLYNINDLFGQFLNNKFFLIPEYQRGYKWDKSNICKLLDDVNDFELSNEDDDKFYCLQSITLVDSNALYYKVIDGQQRLTTLLLLLSVLGKQDLIKFKLQYSIRAETQSFLEQFVMQQTVDLNEYATWDDFIAKQPAYDYQDIFYLFTGYKAIVQWLSEHPQDKESLRIKVLENVKVIINLTDVDSERNLFKNLNGKRVPLDGADLVRAMIITRVAREISNEVEESEKKDILINETRVRIGLRLDAINIWWSDSERRAYFGFFLRNVKLDNESEVDFNSNLYFINNLYKLWIQYANHSSETTISLKQFEQIKDYRNLLDEIERMQRYLESWYEDTEVYHLALYITLYCRKAENKYYEFLDIYDLFTTLPRKKVILELKRIIRNDETINIILQEAKNIPGDINDYVSKMSQEQKTAINSEDWYSRGYELMKVLLLIDIIDLINLSKANVNRLPSRYFINQNEDIEHIFPRTPMGGPRQKSQTAEKKTSLLNEYIRIVNGLLEEGTPINQFAPDDCHWDDEDWVQKTEKDINDKIIPFFPINSLGNICILNGKINRRYGNDFFLEKRIDIMENSSSGDVFIRPHVLDAFNKTFLKRNNTDFDLETMTHWRDSDIYKRRASIMTTIAAFLPEED